MAAGHIAVPPEVKSNKGFIRRMTWATAWGEGLDGYDLGSISVVSLIIAKDLGLSPAALGLIGAGFGLGSGPPAATADEKPAQEMKKPKADAKAEPNTAEVKERTITGKALGHDGKPVAAKK